MFSRVIASITFLTICGPVSAEDVKSEALLVVGNVEYSGDLKEPVIFKPVSDRLSRYSLSLPRHGVSEAIQYQDTASLYYLSHVDDAGLALEQNEVGALNLYMTPKLSRLYYRHPLSPSLSFNLGAKLVEDEIIPSVGSELRYVTGHQGLLKSVVNITNAGFDSFFSHTKLNARENLERIWAFSLSTNKSRLAYGIRWFDFIRGDDLLVEFGLNDKDPVYGLQLERNLNAATFYAGVLTRVTSNKVEAFWGMKFEFSNHTHIRLESDHSLISGSTQSLRNLRRGTLPALWRSQVNIKTVENTYHF